MGCRVLQFKLLLINGVTRVEILSIAGDLKSHALLGAAPLIFSQEVLREGATLSRIMTAKQCKVLALVQMVEEAAPESVVEFNKIVNKSAFYFSC